MRLSVLLICSLFVSSMFAQKATMYSTTHADRWVKSTIKMQTVTSADVTAFNEHATRLGMDCLHPRKVTTA